MTWSRFLVFVGIFLLSTFAFFQNCSDVNFRQVSESSLDAEEPIQTETPDREALQGPTNGDGYTGKVIRHILADLHDECQGNIKGEIHSSDLTYDLIRENCELIEVRRLDSSKIEVVDGSILFEGNSYQTNIPRSCVELYDLGGTSGNGLYLIDADGDGGEEPSAQYCDLTLAGQGWGPWSDWSICDAHCGSGQQNRNRSCHSGNCTGESSQSRGCQLAACP